MFYWKFVKPVSDFFSRDRRRFDPQSSYENGGYLSTERPRRPAPNRRQTRNTANHVERIPESDTFNSSQNNRRVQGKPDELVRSARSASVHQPVLPQRSRTREMYSIDAQLALKNARKGHVTSRQEETAKPSMSIIRVDHTPTKNSSLTAEEIIVIERLREIHNKVYSFVGEIEKSNEPESSNKWHYIWENLNRQVQALDNMTDEINENQYLKEKRKQVYEYIFPLFEILNAIAEENQKTVEEQIMGNICSDLSKKRQNATELKGTSSKLKLSPRARKKTHSKKSRVVARKNDETIIDMNKGIPDEHMALLLANKTGIINTNQTQRYQARDGAGRPSKIVAALQDSFPKQSKVSKLSSGLKASQYKSSNDNNPERTIDHVNQHSHTNRRIKDDSDVPEPTCLPIKFIDENSQSSAQLSNKPTIHSSNSPSAQSASVKLESQTVRTIYSAPVLPTLKAQCEPVADIFSTFTNMSHENLSKHLSSSKSHATNVQELPKAPPKPTYAKVSASEKEKYSVATDVALNSEAQVKINDYSTDLFKLFKEQEAGSPKLQLTKEDEANGKNARANIESFDAQREQKHGTRKSISDARRAFFDETEGVQLASSQRTFEAEYQNQRDMYEKNTNQYIRKLKNEVSRPEGEQNDTKSSYVDLHSLEPGQQPISADHTQFAKERTPEGERLRENADIKLETHSLNPSATSERGVAGEFPQFDKERKSAVEMLSDNADSKLETHSLNHSFISERAVSDEFRQFPKEIKSEGAKLEDHADSKSESNSLNQSFILEEGTSADTPKFAQERKSKELELKENADSKGVIPSLNQYFTSGTGVSAEVPQFTQEKIAPEGAMSTENAKGVGLVTQSLNQSATSQGDVLGDISQEIYDAKIHSLTMILSKAIPFKQEIDNFRELENCNHYYYIEKSLQRLVYQLDDLLDDIPENRALREARKKVYAEIFPMFELLDEKVEENRRTIEGR